MKRNHKLKRTGASTLEMDTVDRYLADAASDEDATVHARCDTVMALTPKLSESADVCWAFDEARQLARRGSPERAGVARLRWYLNPGVAWGAAGVLAVTLVISIQPRGLGEFANREPADANNPSLQTAQTERQTPVPIIAFAPIVISTELAQTLAEVRPVVLLANQTPVDSRSLAVMPFTASANAAMARGSVLSADSIYNQVYRQLSAIPGIYLIDPATAAVYAGSDLPAAEIAQLLGVRGIIEGNVDSIDGGIQFDLSFTDAASAGSSIRRSIARPTAEAALFQSDIASSVLDALAQTPPPDPLEQLL